MEPCVWKIDLSLDADGSNRQESGGRGDEPFEQRRLADAGLAVQEQRPASAAPHRLEQLLEGLELLLTPQELSRPQARPMRCGIFVAARSGRWGARPLLLRGSFP